MQINIISLTGKYLLHQQVYTTFDSSNRYSQIICLKTVRVRFRVHLVLMMNTRGECLAMFGKYL